MPEIIKGRRWMLKFQIVDEIEEEQEVTRAVLKQINHVEIANLEVRGPESPKNEPATRIGPADIKKIILAEDDNGGEPKIKEINTNISAVTIEHRTRSRPGIVPNSSERHKVLNIGAGGGFTIPFEFDFPKKKHEGVGAAVQEGGEEVIPDESDAGDQEKPEAGIRHRDLKFSAAIRPAVKPVPNSILIGSGLAGTNLVAKAVSKHEPNSMHIPSINEFDCVLPVFYMKQPEGYMVVAELILDKCKPQIRRFLLSVYISRYISKDNYEGRQVNIFTPVYEVASREDAGGEVAGDEDLYYIGFHQDRDSRPRKVDLPSSESKSGKVEPSSQKLDQGRDSKTGEDEPPPQRLEFVYGRDGNFVQFATLDLEPDDGFDFYLNGVVPIGIGRWPVSECVTLYYHGDIEEIICDPWSECTRC